MRLTWSSTIAQAQLLNLPISVLGICLIAFSGWLADSARFPPTGVSVDFPEYHPNLLRRLVCIPEHRRRVCRDYDRQRHGCSVVPIDVALARTDHKASHRFSILHWVREQLWPDWAGNRSSDLPRGVRAHLHHPICGCNGDRWAVHLGHALYVVDYKADGV